MLKIGLMSDTHSYLDKQIFDVFADCDEIWHAGDIGTMELADQLEAFRPLRAVYGNIDNKALQTRFPLDLRFDAGGIDVWITHIGGYPSKYPKRIKDVLATNPPHLFICGHSHILRVMPDPLYNCLCMNPGACGIEGWHKVKTVLRFCIDNQRITNLEVVELGARARIE